MSTRSQQVITTVCNMCWESEAFTPFLPKLCELDSVINCNLEMRTQLHRDIKYLAQDLMWSSLPGYWEC